MADNPEQISQNEIEALLREAQGLGGAPPPPSANAGRGEAAAATAESARPKAKGLSDLELPPNDVEFLLRQAEEALASVDAPSRSTPPSASPFHWQEFGGTPASADKATLELLRDVELELKIELGRASMYLEEVLALRKGAVVPLEKLAGDPVDIYVNERLIARGEVLVLNDNFCVRVAELIAGDDV
ncbi:MAG: flagellar motor switch protein FliN [Planctomycetes bacterium]|nr:flagellar motor switch protein FliN [Planctomycetota bacterium]